MLLHLPIIHHHLESIDSTNTWVKTHYKSFDLKRLHLISASKQTHGRGTHGKTWHSPKDVNIYATLFFSLPKENLYQTLAQLLSLCIAKSLSSLNFTPTIKWPNDLLLDEKKVCGILCEITTLSDEVLIILGFGLNVNMTKEDCNRVNQPTTSLLVSSDTSWPIESLLESITSSFQKHLTLYLLEGFAPFHEEYNSYMVYRNYPVSFNGELLGISQTVNVNGELLVRTPLGELKTFSYGSITLDIKNFY